MVDVMVVLSTATGRGRDVVPAVLSFPSPFSGRQTVEKKKGNPFLSRGRLALPMY